MFLKVRYDFGEPGVHDQEGRTVTAHFKTFILVCTYVPNSGVMGLDRLGYRTKEWDLELQKYLKALESEHAKPVIWCGDLNVAHQNIDLYGASKAKEKQAGFTPEEKKSFGDFLTLADFVDTFRRLHPGATKYSYWNLRSGAREKDQGWRLDYFVVSGKLMERVISSDIATEFMGSDHCPISLEIKL